MKQPDGELGPTLFTLREHTERENECIAEIAQIRAFITLARKLGL